MVAENGRVLRETLCCDCILAEDLLSKMSELTLRLCLLIDDGDEKGVAKRIHSLDVYHQRLKNLLTLRRARRDAAKKETQVEA